MGFTVNINFVFISFMACQSLLGYLMPVTLFLQLFQETIPMYHFIPSEFFIPVLMGRGFHGDLNDSKSRQVSRTFQSIQVDHSDAVICIVSYFFSFFQALNNNDNTQKCTGRYKLHESKEKINHLIQIDYIKLFAKNEKKKKKKKRRKPSDR